MNAKPISAGTLHSSVIDEEGKLWVFGFNKSGELGTGDTLSRRRPTKIGGSYTSVSCGRACTIFLCDLGCGVAGSNEYGQIGAGEYIKKVVSVKILSYVPRIIYASAGYKHSIILDEFGVAWSSGNNEFGQLGLGDNQPRFQFEPILHCPEFCLVTCGLKFSILLDVEGNVWFSGIDLLSSMEESDDTFDNSNVPKPITQLSQIKDISSNLTCCLCLDNSGNIWSLGKFIVQNNRNIINLSDLYNLPEMIEISCGENHSIAVDCDKKLWQIDENTRILDNTNRFKFISSGGYHFLSADCDGIVFGYGNNREYQLGLYKSDDIERLKCIPKIAVFDDIYRNIKSARK